MAEPERQCQGWQTYKPQTPVVETPGVNCSLAARNSISAS